MLLTIQRLGIQSAFPTASRNTETDTLQSRDPLPQSSLVIAQRNVSTLKRPTQRSVNSGEWIAKSAWQGLEAKTLYAGSQDARVPKDPKILKASFRCLQEKFPDLEEHSITWGDNTSTEAWYIPPKHHKQTLLLSLGNLETLKSLEKYEPFIKNGYGIITYEYPGFGTTKGIPTQASLIEAAQKVSAFLAEQKNTPHMEQVLVGESLGCNVSVHLAKTGHYKALILNSPMNNFADLVQARLPKLTAWMPIQNYAPSQWKNDEILATLNIPLFVTGFQEDPSIPSPLSKKLYQVSQVPYKQMHLFKGKGHVVEPSRLESEINTFLEQVPSE